MSGDVWKEQIGQLREQNEQPETDDSKMEERFEEKKKLRFMESPGVEARAASFSHVSILPFPNHKIGNSIFSSSIQRFNLDQKSRPTMHNSLAGTGLRLLWDCFQDPRYSLYRVVLQ